MRSVWLSVALSLALVGCSAVANPSLTPNPSVAATPTLAAATASPSASASLTPLEGRWATGPIPIADIKASMLAVGISAAEVDAWVTEVGSPSQFSFVLEFMGTAFAHLEETPDMPMQTGESGTYMLSGRQLLLTIGDAGNGDTYTFAVTLSADELSLRWVDSTEEGTAEDKATHRRFTIAFYCSAVFKRQT